MADASRIDEQLVIWEQRRRAGQPIAVEELCDGDTQQAQELRRRIAALESIDRMLATDSQDQTADAKDSSPAPNSLPPLTETSLESAAKYKLLRRHASGGLGEIIVAQDESFHRQVALKRMQRPVEGDDSRRLRFLREAEITAQLEHPGIVAVHCRGEDSRNGPYYSMRLIQGETLARAIADLHQTGFRHGYDFSENRVLRQLLGRFISVCNTIAFAHSQRVIHRDIKPANIMIGEYGETVVIDWGLAKRLVEEEERPGTDLAGGSAGEANQDIADREAMITVEEVSLGTPAFMSPEQARGQARDLGPASDIYSLGATLYVLLTGQSPGGISNLQAHLARVQRGEFAAPRQLCPYVPAALDAICLKAMAFEPSDRYATALDLAADIDNWLAGEPVSAWREPVGARLVRWIKRHRTIAASVAATLAMGMIGTWILLLVMSQANERLRQANQQEEQAKRAAESNALRATRNAALADQQSELALRTLQTVTYEIQSKLRNAPAVHAVRRRLLDTAVQGLNEVAANLERRPQVNRGLMIAHRELGDVFFEVGSEDDGGGSAAALAQYQRAFSIAEQLAAAAPADTEIQRQLAICHDKLGDIQVRTTSTAVARQHYDASLAIREQLHRLMPLDPQVTGDLAVSHNRLGDLALAGGRTEEGSQHYRAALEIRLGQQQNPSGDADADRNLALCYNKTGEAALRLGDVKQAVVLFEKGLEATRRWSESDPGDAVAERALSISLEKLGKAHWTRGDYQQAYDYYLKTLEVSRRQQAADPANFQLRRDVAQALENMVDVCYKLHREVEADQFAQEAVEIFEQLMAADPGSLAVLRDLALAYSALAARMTAAGQHEKAIDLNRKSLALRQRRAEADPSDTRGPSDVAAGMTHLGDGLMAVGNLEEALEQYSAALAIHQQRCDANPTDARAHYNLAAYHQRIGVACRRTSQFDLAHQHYQLARQTAQQLADHDPDDMQVQLLILGVDHALGLLEQSRQQYSAAREHYERGLSRAQRLAQAGKLTGEDAEWVEYIEQALRELTQLEQSTK